jgi:signal transduction histidine kinase
MESKARLMRGLSHDLKNPLGAIDGHAELMLDGIRGPITEPQRQSLERIRSAVHALLGLITDLLELSRAEAGYLSIEPRRTDPAALVRDAAEEHRAAIEAAGLTLEVIVPDGLPPATTDPRRVRQVLGNLLSNAMKYTPRPGHITVRAEMRRSHGGPREGGWIAVHVQDSGPGIPDDRLADVFDEFARLTPGAAPGAGLGLAIARRIAHLLGGELTVESEVGWGSVFTLWLPATRRGDRPGRRPEALADDLG